MFSVTVLHTRNWVTWRRWKKERMGGVPERKELICWRIMTGKRRTPPPLRTEWKGLQNSRRD